MSERFAIKVIWLDGEEEYLKEGPAVPVLGQAVAVFGNRKLAEKQRDFMLEGMADEVQSINVVPAPQRGEARP